MSPRSEEFMRDARARLAAARTNLEGNLPYVAAGLAYYAMLYAARAALSEEDLYAKTHPGTWTLFRKTFVVTGRIDPDPVEPVERVRELREGADYEAKHPNREEAAEALEQAERFVEAVAEMLDASENA